jgi:predicted glycosyltransferase
MKIVHNEFNSLLNNSILNDIDGKEHDMRFKSFNYKIESQYDNFLVIAPEKLTDYKTKYLMLKQIYSKLGVVS